jgi:Ni,Fe-hydrogenase III large subunit
MRFWLLCAGLLATQVHCSVFSTMAAQFVRAAEKVNAVRKQWTHTRCPYRGNVAEAVRKDFNRSIAAQDQAVAQIHDAVSNWHRL